MALMLVLCTLQKSNLGRQRQTYQRTEVATDTANLLFENLVVEPRLKLSLPGGCSCDVHGGLSTTQNDKLLLWRNSSTVEGGVCVICLENLEVAGRDELGGLVLARGDEVGPVGAPLQVGDLAAELVNRQVEDEVAILAVVLRHGAVLVTGDDVLGKVAPSSDGSLALIAHDDEGLLGVLGSLDVQGDVKHDNGAQVTHTLLGDAQQLSAVLVEFDALDGGGELPGHQALAGLNLPQLDGVVGGTGGNHGGGGVDVDGPDGTLVAVVGAEALTVVREPGANVLVLTGFIISNFSKQDAWVAPRPRCGRLGSA